MCSTELGRALYGGPFLPGRLAASALLSSPDDAALSRWLPGLASGSLTGTVAAAGRDGRWHDSDTMVVAERAAGGWQLTGTRWNVIGGQVASVCVVPAVSAAGLGLYVVELPATDVTAAPMPALDLTRRLSAVEFRRAPGVQIAEGEAGRNALLTVRTQLDLGGSRRSGRGYCLVPGHRRQLREGPVPVRPSHRVVPGRRASVRGHARRPAGSVSGGPVCGRSDGGGRRRCSTFY